MRGTRHTSIVWWNVMIFNSTVTILSQKQCFENKRTKKKCALKTHGLKFPWCGNSFSAFILDYAYFIREMKKKKSDDMKLGFWYVCRLSMLFYFFVPFLFIFFFIFYFAIVISWTHMNRFLVFEWCHAGSEQQKEKKKKILSVSQCALNVHCCRLYEIHS